MGQGVLLREKNEREKGKPFLKYLTFNKNVIQKQHTVMVDDSGKSYLS